jgi:hypothetical protein
MVFKSASFCRVPDLVSVSTERQKQARAIVTAMTRWMALPCRVVPSKPQPRYANRTNATPHRFLYVSFIQHMHGIYSVFMRLTSCWCIPTIALVKKHTSTLVEVLFTCK